MLNRSRIDCASVTVKELSCDVGETFLVEYQDFPSVERFNHTKANKLLIYFIFSRDRFIGSFGSCRIDGIDK